MSTQRTFLILVWAVLFTLAVDTSFTLLNQKNTYLNIGGVFFLVGVLLISLKTRAFTKNPFKTKNDE